MKPFLKLSLVISFLVLSIQTAAWAQAKRSPDVAFNPVTNRYLMVWEEETTNGTVIKGQLRNINGTPVTADEVVLSPVRPTQGCFFQSFDTDNGAVTTPTNCPINKNPSVAYNNGQFLVAWEVQGTAMVPASSPDNQFSGIFIRILDAGTLNPLPGFEEGVLISKIFLAANNAQSSCGDRHVCSDGDLQAWSQAINPSVAPRVNAGGFVVAWQTNKDFIGCADSNRRRAWSVYGRYVDQSFSAVPGSSNPQPFAVFKDDSTSTAVCESLNNVDSGSNPIIAYSQTGNDFVVAYDIARASGGNSAIGAKRISLNSSNVGEVSGTAMPDLVAYVNGASLTQGTLVSYHNNFVLFAHDGTNIRGKTFSSASISPSEPAVISLGGGSQASPHAASNLGLGGERPSGSNLTPERLVLTYEQNGDLRAAILDNAFAITAGPVNVSSGIATNNRAGGVASDFHDFVATWQGNASGEKVFAGFIESEGPLPSPSPSPSPNLPPTVPNLLTPNDNVTFAPTRAYLSWSPSTDPEGGAVTYNVYFGENVIPAVPQVTGLTNAEYIIGPETQSITGITLTANRVYKWKVEAVDNEGQRISSVVRTLNTDNSVVGWWRFDDNPAAIDCLGESGAETVCDSSVANNHGIPMGGPTWLPAMPGILGRALDFDGVDNNVEVANAVSLNPTTFSIQAKIAVNGATGFEQSIIDKRGSGFGYEFRVYGAAFPLNFEFVVKSDSTTETSELQAAGILQNNPYIIIGTYNNTNKTTSLYNNNLLIGSHVASGPFSRTVPSPQPLKIGKLSFTVATPTEFDGLIDEIILFNKELSSTEATNNYDASIN